MGVRSVNGQDLAMQMSVSAARAPASTAQAANASERTSTQTRNVSGSGEERAEKQINDVNEIQTDTTVQRNGTRLRIDKESDQVVAQIVDENNEVIRQIPPEEMLNIAARFKELQGKLFDQKV